MNFLITFIKKTAPVMVVFVFMLTVLNFGSYDPYNELTVLKPSTVEASLSGVNLTDPDLLTPALTIPKLEIPTSSPDNTTPTPSTNTIQSCEVSSNASTVYAGTSVTISWATQGFSTATLNGVPVDSLSGTKTFNNVEANTTYTLIAKTADGKSDCTSVVTIICVPPPVVTKTCTELGYDFTAAKAVWNGSIYVKEDVHPDYQITVAGNDVQANWTSNKSIAAVIAEAGSTSKVFPGGLNGVVTKCDIGTGCTNISKLQFCGNNPVVPPPTVKVCELTLTKAVSKSTARIGDELTYTINIKNTGTKDCTGGGVKILDIHDENIIYLSETHTDNLNAGYGTLPVYASSTRTLFWNGNTLTPGEEGTITWKGKVKSGLLCDTNTIIKNKAKATALELKNYSVWAYSNEVETLVTNPCVVPVPKCEAFTATPSTITRGNSAQLSFVTSNTNRVVINNGIGEVAATGTLSVTPLATTEYLLTAFGANDQKNTCLVKLTVEEPPVVPVPKCEAFTATPNSLPVGGGNVVLNWSTSNASAVSIAPAIGSVAINGSTTVALTASTTFTLTASDTKGKKDICTIAVPVALPPLVPITCESNVNLSTDASTISRGNSATLSWNTNGITGVTFDNGITSTGLSGTTSVSPTDSTTYTLTATDGKDTIKCPITISVRTSGGGGGGSSAPRCELSISDNKISRGDKVVLTWDSSRASDLLIEDQTTDEVLVTTEKLSSSAKDRLLDGTLTVSPEKDTTYLLTVKRGSSKRTCSVKVDVENNIVVTQVRDQQPLVAGISLTEVPYTGFEAGPILTLLFYTLLMAWALYIAYLIVIRRDGMGSYQFAASKPVDINVRPTPELIRPDVFVAKVQAPIMPISTLTPNNLPTGTPVIGYASAATSGAAILSTNVHNIDDEEMTKIENYAHAQRVLLSSDAIRHFIATTNNQEERLEALDQVLQAAKTQFPSEDGWVVLNEKRMKEICIVCAVNSVHSNEAPYIPAVIPEGAGSLAEAIVTGNVLAAYEMIGNRPMFALADASADLDAIYRIRRGEKGSVSELLTKETAALTDAQILQMIGALTGALDGTYTDEASAVKMAIMKAIKVVA